jgi:hypothetical protein
MTERQQREFDSIRRSRDFLVRLKGLTPELTAIAKKLSDVITRIKAVEERARGHALPAFGRSVTLQANLLREEHLIPLARRGKQIFRGEPRFERAMRAPHKRAGAEQVLASARQMIAAITPHKRHFLAAGAAPAFLTDLRAATAQLGANLKLVDKSRRLMDGVNRELKREIAAGRREVHIAASLVPAWVRRHDPRGGLDAAWSSVHRVGARIGRPSARRMKHRKRRDDGSTDVME